MAVVVALDIEARTLASAVTALEGRVYISGPGPARAAAAARDAIAAGAKALLSWGIAGALSGERRPGDVLLPARVLSAAGEWTTDADWRQRLATGLGRDFDISDAPLYSAPEVVTSPSAKRTLAERTGAAAVDMETAAIAQVAAAASLPCIAVRVIADGSADALPRGIGSLVTTGGRTRYRGLWPLLLAPSQIPQLYRLARRSGTACRVLRRLAGRCTGKPN
jgi:adenosylhomocysteine nucleosidase